MRRLPVLRSWSSVGRVAAVLSILAATACGPSAVKGPVVPHSEVFASDVQALLLAKPGSDERTKRLFAVAAHQAERAARRFKQRDPEGGLAALAGALSLVKAGEFAPQMLGANGTFLLDNAAREYAKQGDDGRALAAYRLLVRTAPAGSPLAKDAAERVETLRAWTENGSPPIAAKAGDARAHQIDQLLEPTTEARDEAAQKTRAWVESAFSVHERFRKAKAGQGEAPAPEEAYEASRAFSSAPPLLAAVYLRNADAAGAAHALDAPAFRAISQNELLELLDRAANAPSAATWLEVSRVLRPEENSDSETAPVLRAASLAAGVEAFRLDPTNASAALTTAIWLTEIDMGDAGAAILSSAASESSDPQFLALALDVVAGGLRQALGDEGGGTEARAIYKEAMPLLKLAQLPKMADKLKQKEGHSDVAEIDELLADAWVREANLAEAERVLRALVTAHPTANRYVSLARILDHKGDTAEAVALLAKADGASEAGSLEQASLRTMRGALERRRGNATAARAAFSAAATILGRARVAVSPEVRARAERMAGTVLDEAGETKRAMAANLRSIEIPVRKESVQGALIGNVVARALVAHDVEAAHRALDKALAFDLDDEDLIYAALWTSALERAAHLPEGDAVRRILSRGESDPRWVGALARVAHKKLGRGDLFALAETPAQKCEARFYEALETELAGDAKGAAKGFEATVAIGALDVVEYQLARDFLDKTRSTALGLPVSGDFP